VLESVDRVRLRLEAASTLAAVVHFRNDVLQKFHTCTFQRLLPVAIGIKYNHPTMLDPTPPGIFKHSPPFPTELQTQMPSFVSLSLPSGPSNLYSLILNDLPSDLYMTTYSHSQILVPEGCP
jgi:hypothetical protein